MNERLKMPITLIALLAIVCLSGAVAQDWYGAPPEKPGDSIGVAALMADPDARLDRRLSVSGRMTDVCTNRGCWAVLEEDGEMLRIVARDHAFSIPADLRGAAVAHGVFERHEISREAAEHMVEADGADPALLDDPAAYRLVADGVRLAR